MNALLHLVIVVLLFPTAAFAQNRSGDDSAARLTGFLERFPESDLNKDGELTRDEVREFNQQRRRPSANAGDQNRQRPKPTSADVAYGTHPQQRFDVWAAPDANAATPLVIFIHGGGFRGGDKRGFNPTVIEFYHKHGIAFASVNYRLSDAGPYPMMMEDCALGLQTIRHRASEWNIDPEKIGCYGGSAGAGISLWLAFHKDLAKTDSDDPIARQSTRIAAAGTSGGQSTYDLRTFREWFDLPELVPHPALIPFYGIQHEDDWNSPRVIALMEDASPISHLSADDNAPVYMSYSRGDVPVTAESNASLWVHHYRLGAKLKEAMEPLGKECHLTEPGQPKSERKYRDMQTFFVAKLKGE